MMHLPHVAMQGIDKHAMHEVMTQGDAQGDKEWRAKKRILSLLSDGSTCKVDEATRTWGLKFLLSPIEFLSEGGSLNKINFAVNKLTQSASSTSVIGSEPATQSPPRLLATPTDQTHEEQYDLVIESIGYRSEQIDDIPFDASKGVIRNSGGRVVDDEGVNVGV